jgi:hypothetical protein
MTQMTPKTPLFDDDELNAKLRLAYKQHANLMETDGEDAAREAVISFLASNGLAPDQPDDFGSPIGGYVQSLLTMAAMRDRRLLDGLDSEGAPQSSQVSRRYLKKHIFEIYRQTLTGEPENAIDALNVVLNEMGWTAEQALAEGSPSDV